MSSFRMWLKALMLWPLKTLILWLKASMLWLKTLIAWLKTLMLWPLKTLILWLKNLMLGSIGGSYYQGVTVIGSKAIVGNVYNADDDPTEQAIARWICLFDFSTEQEEAFGKHQQGTGRWFLKTDLFKHWVAGAKRILWCRGQVGAGKTTLISIVVDHLGRRPRPENAPVLYVYCHYKNKDTQTPESLLRCLLRQLCQRKRSLSSDRILSLYHQYTEGTDRPRTSDWSKWFMDEVRQVSMVYIIIDALDECDESNREALLKQLKTLSDELQHVQLLFTSRQNVDIDHIFDEDALACVDIKATDKDIRKYIKGQIDENALWSKRLKLDSNPTLKTLIEDKIIETSQGMFLVATLHMNSLLCQYNARGVRETLKNLPKDLDQTYDDAIKRIKKQDRKHSELAMRVLCWVSYTFRPLAITELRHALAVILEEESFDTDNETAEEFLVSICAGLVTMNQDSRYAHLVHYSAQEYFKNNSPVASPHSDILAVCLRYMSYSAFGTGPCLNDKELLDRYRKHPLLGYAAKYWGHHCLASTEPVNQELAVEFLLGSKSEKFMSSVQAMQVPYYPYTGYRPEKGFSQFFSKVVKPLHVAANFGLNGIVNLLLKNDTPVDIEDGHKRTALHVASQKGHEEVVKSLLEHGADINARDYNRMNALEIAADNGHYAVVEVLVDEGADVNESVGDATALDWASANGHDEVVRFLEQKMGFKVGSHAVVAHGFPPRMTTIGASHPPSIRTPDGLFF